MKIVQTIAGTRADHGGTSRSVPALCDALNESGVVCHLVTAVPADPGIASNFPADMTRVHTVRESALWRQRGVAKGFVRHLRALQKSSSGNFLVHDHAVWLSTNHAVAKYCRDAGVQRIVSPRGMLGHWALNNGRWKKRVAWWAYQGSDLRSADGFHATSEQEAEEIRKLGLKQPIAVAPNGLSLPDTLPSSQPDKKKQFLFLSRLHPKKGLIPLLIAWHESDAVSLDWKLVIAGPDEGGYRNEVERTVETLGLRSSVRLIGEVHGDAKWQCYADSSYFILPSFNENFGIVIAEALGCGLPVITTRSTPWSLIAEENLGWWIDHEHATLVGAINAAVRLPEADRVSMSKRARTAVRSRFVWSETARRLRLFYEEILAGR